MTGKSKFGLEGVVALAGGSGALQRPERNSWHELGISLRAAITQTAPPKDTVTPREEGARLPNGSDDLESTRTLLELTRGGDPSARERLFERYFPLLQAWARGRLPRKARGLSDTNDLVQETFLKAFEHLDRIEHLHEGGFFAYLRTVARHRVIDLLRRQEARPEGENIPPGLEAPGPSPFDEAVGREIMDAYETALGTLNAQQSAAVSLRIELGLTFQEVADAVGCPSANAARMLVARAIVRLSEVMDAHGTQ